MKRRRIIILIVLVTILFSLGHLLIQQNLEYKLVSKRFASILIDSRIQDYIDSSGLSYPNPDINVIIDLSLELTTKKLKFTTTQISNSPVDLYDTGKAHCVGYASLYCAICNQLLKQNGLYKTWRAEQVVGELFFCSINIHQFFNSEFLKDHDFVIIMNLDTNEQIAIDPVLYDYLKIKQIRLKSN